MALGWYVLNVSRGSLLCLNRHNWRESDQPSIGRKPAPGNIVRILSSKYGPEVKTQTSGFRMPISSTRRQSNSAITCSSGHDGPPPLTSNLLTLQYAYEYSAICNVRSSFRQTAWNGD